MGAETIRLLHIITGLDLGGAETMLFNLARGLNARRFDQRVISLSSGGVYAGMLREQSIPLCELGMQKQAFSAAKALVQLNGMIREFSPQVIQTWMYHADLLGGLAGWLGGHSPVVWGIHNSTLSPRHTRPETFRVVRLCARFSKWIPERIVSCSQKSAKIHVELGYAAGKMEVIPNGYDLDRFKPDTAARAALRAEMELPPDALLVGMAARFDPQKDHITFLRAAAALHASHPEVHFALCGDGVDDENPALAGEIAAGNLEGMVYLAGRRMDVECFHAALDVSTLTSAYGEAFPLVVGEAMACGVPCVVTDVGDAALLVGDSGRVVPPGDAAGLSAAWADLIDLGMDVRQDLGMQARRSIQERFSLENTIGQYASLYERISGFAR